jgi:hypothetical protein
MNQIKFNLTDEEIKLLDENVAEAFALGKIKELSRKELFVRMNKFIKLNMALQKKEEEDKQKAEEQRIIRLKMIDDEKK